MPTRWVGFSIVAENCIKNNKYDFKDYNVKLKLGYILSKIMFKKNIILLFEKEALSSSQLFLLTVYTQITLLCYNFCADYSTFFINKKESKQKVRFCVKLERVARIELALSGRKHDILPLNYTRVAFIF